MACVKGRGFCVGPGAVGSKCLACQKAETESAPASTAPAVAAAATAASASHALARPVGLRAPPPVPSRASKVQALSKLAKPVVSAAALSTPTPASPVKVNVEPAHAEPVVEPPPATPVLAAAEAGAPLPFVYRGDTRPFAKLQHTGFVAWRPMDLAQARDLIKLYTGAKTLDECSFRDMVLRNQVTLEDNNYTKVRNPLDLSQWIIRSKAPGPSVSTDPTEECGGYANGFIYRIDSSNLREVSWKTAVPNMRGRELGTWPKLFLDSQHLDTATTIAIKSRGSTEEVTFFTPIPPERISLHKTL